MKITAHLSVPLEVSLEGRTLPEAIEHQLLKDLKEGKFTFELVSFDPVALDLEQSA